MKKMAAEEAKAPNPPVGWQSIEETRKKEFREMGADGLLHCAAQDLANAKQDDMVSEFAPLEDIVARSNEAVSFVSTAAIALAAAMWPQVLLGWLA